MHRIELDDEELRLVRAALSSFRQDFGHDEHEILELVQHLLARLPAVPRRG